MSSRSVGTADGSGRGRKVVLYEDGVFQDDGRQETLIADRVEGVSSVDTPNSFLNLILSAKFRQFLLVKKRYFC